MAAPETPQSRHSIRRPLSIAAATAVAAIVLPLASAALPASAAETIEGGTGEASWGFIGRGNRYVNQFGGDPTPAWPDGCEPGTLATQTPYPADCALPFDVTDATWDSSEGAMTATLSDFSYDVPAHGIEIDFADVRVAYDPATATGAITADVSGNPGSVPEAVDDFELASVGFGLETEMDDSGASVIYRNLETTIAADISDVIPSFGAYNGVAGEPLDLTIDPAAEPVTTTLDLPNSPALTVAPATTSLVATVTASEGSPEGEVEFATLLDGTTEPTVLGSAEVVDGVATLTPELEPGGNAVTATFTGAGFVTSTDTSTYRVVDPTEPEVCDAAGSPTSDEGALVWSWSEYSASWAKSGTGDVAAADGRFVLTGGDITADADCTTVAFDGDMRFTLYGGLVVFSVTDPTLHVDADGAGSLVGDVTATTGGSTSGPTSVTVGTFSGVDLEGLAQGMSSDVAFDYADTTAAGTWSTGRSAAWPNSLILAMPSSTRAFFYESGASQDASKPPATASLSLEGVPTSTTIESVTEGAAYGDEVTIDVAVVAPAAEGGFVSLDLGDLWVLLPVTDGTASLTTDALHAGVYAVTAEYVAPSGYAASSSPATTLRIAKATTVATVSGERFKKRTRPEVTVQLADLANGASPTGYVTLRVDGKKDSRIKITGSHEGVKTVSLANKYSKAITVTAKYEGSDDVKQAKSEAVKLRLK